ncbi:MAG: TIGR02265 family protein [Polyangiaceae bacterium]
MPGRGNVKGSVLQSRIEFVQRHRGPEGAQRVLARLPDAERATLAGLVMPFAWYPFELNERLDHAIALEMGRGDAIFRELGAASADDNLTSASQLHCMREHNPHALLKQASGIYSVYYDTGHREYEHLGDSKAGLRTHDSLSFSVSDCLTVVGWHERAIEMCGGRNVRVAEPQCRALGGAVCEYVCEWD